MEQLIKTLKTKNFSAYWVETKEEAKELALSLIPANASIAMGNSQTIREIGLFDELISGDYNFINQFEKGISPEENLQRRKNGLLSDVYLSSTNAITLDGKLINIDGKGNRVGAMMFGPDKVIIIAGKNKVVENEEAAWQHLRQYTAPGLAKKLGRQTPCATTGVCSDCSSPQRICRCYTMISSQMPADQNRINIIVVNQELGL